MKCPVCNDKELVGRQKYCSGACKMKASRNRNIEDENVTLPTVTPSNVTNSRGDVVPQTQAETEAHYTYENFPSLKYGPSNSPNPPHMRSRTT